jgi:hypothetical protein
MPKRNVPLTPTTAYHVFRENGSHYTVYSKQALDRRIEDGRITDTCRVVITKVNN